MKGVAYSLDKSLGYSYIFIKVYDDSVQEDTDDINACQLYNFSRKSLKLTLLYSPKTMDSIRLSLDYAQKILKLLVSEECKSMFPVRISWEIFASASPVLRSSRDLGGFWHLKPVFAILSGEYFNATALFFKETPSYLVSSFLCDILNEAIYHSGIYISDCFILCGNNIFCSLELAKALNELYADKPFLDFAKYKPAKTLPRIKKRHILSVLKTLDFEEYLPNTEPGELIVCIKADMLNGMLFYIRESLKNKRSFKWLKRRLSVLFVRGSKDIIKLASICLVHTGLYKNSDVGYLHFNELMAAFTFGDNLLSGVKLVRKNRERSSELKKLTPPKYLSNGKFIAG